MGAIDSLLSAESIPISVFDPPIFENLTGCNLSCLFKKEHPRSQPGRRQGSGASHRPSELNPQDDFPEERDCDKVIRVDWSEICGIGRPACTPGNCLDYGKAWDGPRVKHHRFPAIHCLTHFLGPIS
jgi:hypothetical protein